MIELNQNLLRRMARATLLTAVIGVGLITSVGRLQAEATYTFTTVAGGGVPGTANGTGSAAGFFSPLGVAVDSSGTVYVADSGNHMIRKITATGVVTTLAGLAGNAGIADGTGSAARFNSPQGIAVDGSGTVYVADTVNNTIRKITPGGVVTTLAGVAGGNGSTDGTGSAARFSGPTGMTADDSGTIYVADTYNNTIRKITPAGVVTTLAGSASAQGSTDGTGSAARFNSPVAVAVNRSGTVYVAERVNNTIRKITASGVVTTLAGLAGIPNAGSADGTGSAAQFLEPRGVAVDASGTVFVSDSRNHTIRKITPAGVVTTLAGLVGVNGSTDGTNSDARFSIPTGLAVDGSGTIYVADNANCNIRKGVPPIMLSPGTISGGTLETAMAVTLTANGGTAPYTFTVTGGSLPDGLTLAGNGSLTGIPLALGAYSFIITATDANGGTGFATYRGTIGASAYVFTTLAGSVGNLGSVDGVGSAARFFGPYSVAVNGSGTVYVADIQNNTIRKITAAGVVTTLAGLAEVAGSTDGVGSAARFNTPYGVAVDGSGNVYVADTGNRTIRKITPAGVVTTLAGLAGQGGSADGIGSEARFAGPFGVAADGSGTVYVADFYNHNIRKITPAGLVTTLAGFAGEFVATNYACIDGTGSEARFNAPTGVAVDFSGTVYVADAGNDTIRKITPAGVVTTLAGVPGQDGGADGPGSEAQFHAPWGVTVDSSGTVSVADYLNHTIRRISPAGVVTTLAGLAGAPGDTDGIASVARFSYPMGVAVDLSGNIYVADPGNCTIRKGSLVALDADKPTVIAASPPNKAIVTTASVTVSGTAKDATGSTNTGVMQVVYSLNGGPFQLASTANHFSNWTANVTLVPGTNTLVVKAFDYNGNVSTITTNTYFLKVLEPLTIVTAGPGSVSMATGTNLVLTTTYTMTATPGANALFMSWSNSLTHEIITTNKYTFVMQSGLSITANFIHNPFTESAGTYNGLFYETNAVTHASSGYFNFVLTSTRTFTGKILIDGDSINLNGTFSLGQQQAVVTVVRPNKPSNLAVTMQILETNSTYQVVGTVTDGTWTAPLLGDKAYYLTGNIAPQAGVYTMAFLTDSNGDTNPSNGSYGLATVKTNGSLILSGLMSDASSLSQVTYISKSGQWPLYVPLYTAKLVYTNNSVVYTNSVAKGSLLGWVTFTNQPTSKLTGDVSWIKSTAMGGISVPFGLYYTYGFTNSVTANGGSRHP